MARPPRNRVRVHVANDPGAPPAEHISAEKFWNAFPQAQRMERRISLSVGSGEDGLAEALPAMDVLLGNRIRARALVGQAPRLRWVHIMSAGVDFLRPFDWLPDHVVMTKSSGVHVPKAGEFATAALLMLNNLIPFYITNQQQHRWVKVHSPTIRGKTAVIIGVGAIGGEAARKAKMLGLRVLGVRRSGRRHRYVDRMYRPDRLRDILPAADFVLITAPLTQTTAGLLGRAELDLLKPTAGLVNVGRAAIVDYTALAEKLNNGALGGAILDVFNPEPLPEHSPLWDCSNLIILPHTTLDAPDYGVRVLRIFADNLRRFIAGKELRNVVDRDAGY